MPGAGADVRQAEEDSDLAVLAGASPKELLEQILLSERQQAEVKVLLEAVERSLSNKIQVLVGKLGVYGAHHIDSDRTVYFGSYKFPDGRKKFFIKPPPHAQVPEL